MSHKNNAYAYANATPPTEVMSVAQWREYYMPILGGLIFSGAGIAIAHYAKKSKVGFGIGGAVIGLVAGFLGSNIFTPIQTALDSTKTAPHLIDKNGYAINNSGNRIDTAGNIMRDASGNIIRGNL